MYLLQASMGAGMAILGLLTILILIGIPVLTIIFKMSGGRNKKNDSPDVKQMFVENEIENPDKSTPKEEIKSWISSFGYAIVAIITIMLILFFLIGIFGPKDFES